MAKKKGFEVCFLNVRSLLKNKDELFDLLKDPDILCVGESWINDSHTDTLISQPGYKLLRQDGCM